ncbi:MAG: phenylalanine--tRNA ligase subunit beta [Lachnospiraceae bacterium]|nr:phenylalanine--tRNA ligase subunit beta [Lachnospiraceae bacterium]
MNTSFNWIKDLVPGLDCSAQEYMDAMTLSGTKGEGFVTLDKNLEKIVVGEVESMEKHPDSDHLWICQVNIGAEKIQIVTGAQNLKVGDRVPTVLDGGKVAGGHDGSPLPENGIEIKAGKLRGVESNGMMCGIEELGSSREVFPDAPENGIYVFPKDADVKPGDDAVHALGLDDTIHEYEVTSNRVDCYSVLGIAREAAATFRLPFKPPVVPETGANASEKSSDYIKVSIEADDLCTRYVGRVVKDIKIAESPEWMKKRLRASGIRPINNLVDITNYVMIEYGQPMHAYDLSTVAGNEIIVRRAKDGETFVTLDGQERKLDSDVLMICDGEKEIGLAGIMGGQNSMITEDVKTVLFEAATFNGPNIRKAAKRIGIRTDASGIFEKGLDANNAIEAMNRACALVEELGCGTVLNGAVDVHSELPQPVHITFEPERTNEFLGTDISREDMLSYFKPLEIVYDEAKNELICPTFRQDLKSFADISEEVARFFGYDKIPTTLPKSGATAGKLSFKMRVEGVARDVVEFAGYSEAMCYSFESPKVFDKLLLPEDAKERQVIKISNPLGEDFSVMRTLTLNGMLNSLALNYNRRNKNVKLYELGSVYLPKALPLTELPDEREKLTLGFYGEGDFFTLKGVVEEVLSRAGLKLKPEYDPNAGLPYMHPGRQANIIYDGKVIGFLGEVHPEVCDNYDLDTKAYVAVIDMLDVVEKATFARHFNGIAKFPAVTRDISMLVPKSVLAGQIEAMLAQRGGKILENYALFDIYEGAQVKAGFKSIAYTLSFRDKEKTLADDEVNSAMKKILNGLESLGIELRS